MGPILVPVPATAPTKWDDETMAEAEVRHVAEHGPLLPHRLGVIIRKFRDDDDYDDRVP
jgi:hypothetical protein